MQLRNKTIRVYVETKRERYLRGVLTTELSDYSFVNYASQIAFVSSHARILLVARIGGRIRLDVCGVQPTYTGNNTPKRKEHTMKDYFNEVIRPALERMETAMGITHIQVSYVPSLATISVREHCRHLEVIGGECANPDCRAAIEVFDEREYED